MYAVYCSAKTKAPTDFLVLTISKLADDGSDEQGGQEAAAAVPSDGTPDGGILRTCTYGLLLYHP
eukprot:COSAG05_NODE_11_length_38500_cov_831.349861_11_plen_65_part_00